MAHPDTPPAFPVLRSLGLIVPVLVLGSSAVLAGPPVEPAGRVE